VFFAIAGIIGNTAAQQLISVFGGDKLYISNGLKHHLATRNDAIRAEFDELTKTLSVNAAIRRLSLSYRLSNRWIHAITKRLD
jgi:Mor family transcriptional regulator